MIEISKKQAEFIKAHSPTTKITITNKQATNSAQKKSRFVEETGTVKKLLKQFSEEVEKVVYTYGKVD